MLKIAATFCAAFIIAASALATSADARGFGGGARMGGFGGARMGGFAGPRFGAARFGAARMIRRAWQGCLDRARCLGRQRRLGRQMGWRQMGWRLARGTLVALVGCRHWRRTGRRVAVLRRLRLRLLRPVDTGLRMGEHLRLSVQRLLLLTSI